MAAAVPLALTACSSQGGGQTQTEDGKTILSLWTHSAGNELEMNVISQIVDDFNESQSDYVVQRQDFPQDAYNDSVQGAAAANQLPCILDVDGPIMPNWAWNGWLVPTGLTDADVADFLPSTIGRYNDQVYSIGYWDVNTVLFVRKSAVESAGARIPTADEPWTKAEFDELQDKIKASGEYEYVIDYGPSSTGEWWPYAFAPILQSFGGDLIDRDGFETAEGALNGPEALEFATWFQRQFAEEYAPKSNAQDRTEFLDGKVAMQWNGIWGYSENIEKYPDDLLVVPLPDFGGGSKAGVGSWQYGLSKSCNEEQLAGGLAYLKFSMDDKYIAQFSDVTSLIPATASGAALTEKGFYGEGNPLEVAYQISEEYGLVRPETPAYPVISQVFEKNVSDLVNGTDPQKTLDQMVSEIDADINSAGYNNS